MNAKELAQAMAESVTQIVEHLLPQGKRAGKEWKAGSTGGESGGSLSVCISGAKRGVWKDFNAGVGGDLLDLWMECRALSIADAMREAKRFLGIRDDMPQRPMPSYKRPAKPLCHKPTSLVGDWLSARGLNDVTIADFKVAEQVRGEKTFVIFPYMRDGELINAKARNIVDKKDMRQEGGAEPCLFGWHLIDPKCRAIAIAEGEIDAMSLHQMGIPALSVNAGAGNHQWIDSDWDRLERFSEIYLCYDADEPGQKGAREVANRLGLERCRIVKFGEAKDANDFLLAGAVAEDFCQCLEAGRTFDPDELKTIDQFWGGVKALFHPAHGAQAGPYLSFCGQHEFWFELRPGEVTVWTGYNGHGKSLLLNQVLVGLMFQGERVCVFSGEMKPDRQGQRVAKQLGGLKRPTLEYLDHMAAWLGDRMWLFDLLGTASIDRLISVFTYGFKRYGIRQFVIDSLMMTDVLEDGHGAMSSQKEAMRKITAFARQMGVHVHLVAHPRKGQDEKRSPGKMDVSGSSKITDAADNVFAVWSAQKEADDLSTDQPDATLTLWKQRNGDMQHRSLWLFFNREAQQFSRNSSRAAFTYLSYPSPRAETNATADE
ncbi:toprim domain-containing protein [Pandoraea sp. NPDC090278]|uniref:toprim domain-containing protein n=1 Tax=Pandoraea sp. NPDC090278 TaxID=3364391 RepID=UPI00383B756A